MCACVRWWWWWWWWWCTQTHAPARSPRSRFDRAGSPRTSACRAVPGSACTRHPRARATQTAPERRTQGTATRQQPVQQRQQQQQQQHRHRARTAVVMTTMLLLLMMKRRRDSVVAACWRVRDWPAREERGGGGDPAGASCGRGRAAACWRSARRSPGAPRNRRTPGAARRCPATPGASTPRPRSCCSCSSAGAGTW